MMFKAPFHEGIVSGAITTTFRYWKRAQARVGGIQKISTIGHIEIIDVRVVAKTAVTGRDAKRAGFASRDAMFAYLREFDGDGRDLYRIDFRFVGRRTDREPDRSALRSADDFTAIEKALDLRDRNGKRGPWTRATLRLIARNPGMGSARMAERLGCPQPDLKQDVRKLKKLGLTISLETGYRLSAKGESYARRHRWI